MQCKSTRSNTHAGYPRKKKNTTHTVTSLLIGATLTASLALISCSQSDTKTTAPTLPPQTVNDKDAGAEKSAPLPSTAEVEVAEVINNRPNPQMRLTGTMPAPRSQKDSDGDGVPDNIDRCPNRKGSARYHGCPRPRRRGRIARPRHP